jgi:hypothetical protein
MNTRNETQSCIHLCTHAYTCAPMYICVCALSVVMTRRTRLPLAATICCRASLLGETSRTLGCVQEGMRELTFFPWILARPMRSLPVSRSACGFPSVGSSTDCAPSAHAHTHVHIHARTCTTVRDSPRHADSSTPEATRRRMFAQTEVGERGSH